jgi:AhpD family alkylhydroperoxidase
MADLFPLHDTSTAPAESQALLQRAEKNLGMIPNLERVMATAPALLAGYVELWELFDKTSFNPIERQVVYQTANFENECEYCVPWHSKLCQLAGADAETIDALRNGRRLRDPRLEALRQFSQSLIRTKGKIATADLEAFLAAGWTPRHALEAILGIAVKTMSNFTNSIAGTPLDSAVKKLAWRKPIIRSRSDLDA